MFILISYFFTMPAQKPGENKTPKTEDTARLTELRETLTLKKVDFTEENTVEELETLLNATLIEEIQAELTAKEIPFEDGLTYDEYFNLLEDYVPAKTEEPAEKLPYLERVKERRQARIDERAAQEDKIPVFSTVSTNWGPKFTVVEMSKVDVKAYGKKVVFPSKLPL